MLLVWVGLVGLGARTEWGLAVRAHQGAGRPQEELLEGLPTRDLPTRHDRELSFERAIYLEQGTAERFLLRILGVSYYRGGETPKSGIARLESWEAPPFFELTPTKESTILPCFTARTVGSATTLRALARSWFKSLSTLGGSGFGEAKGGLQKRGGIGIKTEKGGGNICRKQQA